MYKIIFYEDRKGRSPVRDYTNRLALKGDKDSRIKFRKIKRDIEFLISHGTRIGEPVVKHLRGGNVTSHPNDAAEFLITVMYSPRL